MPRVAPPRYVPTLTEVVQAPAGAPQPTPSAEQITERVLQRIDLTLDRRVREAIATVLLEQTATLVPLIRARIEEAVHEVVAQAVRDERPPAPDPSISANPANPANP